MKRYVILLVVCVSVFCLIFSIKDRLSNDEPIGKSSQESTSLDDDILLFEPQTSIQDITLPTQDVTTTDTTTTTTTEDVQQTSSTDYIPLNFDTQKAMWFAFMDYNTILLDKSEDEFRQSIEQRFENAKDLGINTVYVHVRSHGDSYYISDIFPKGKYYNSDFDPLQIMVEVAHEKGLSIHAWINPMRCMDTQLMENLSSDYILKDWCDKYSGTYINEYNGYWYLNPYYEEVRQLICDGVAEIVNNYQVDGINIDDYFYPTTDEDFDSPCFADSNQSDLLQFRRDNVSKMVQEIYSTIKSINPSVEFGISPQGNVDKNYNEQCADVYLWTSTEGYCDYIAPQIYYGFDNSTCPYIDTLNQWIDMNKDSSVKLIIGVGTYKIGLEDVWAGSGSNEWIEDTNIVGCQIDYAFNSSEVDGIAIYSYSSTFEPTGDTSVIDKVNQEREYIKESIAKH
ncbi:MAG: family 10 glycosylhydrolase [Ruminococcus sp.]|nr:family 10 glycosylhydrolase [Ruminococcus sp.]